MKVDRESLAWGAGFFDGEGCFTLTKSRNGRVYPKACIAQVDRAVLDRFGRVTGLGEGRGPYPRRKFTERSIYQYTTDGHEGVQALLAMLWNHLGRVKRTQGRSVLLGFRAQPPDGRKWRAGRCRRGHDVSIPGNRQIGADGRVRCLPCRQHANRERLRMKYRLRHGIPLDAPILKGPRKGDAVRLPSRNRQSEGW